MKSFQLDTEKMPLGKLSKKQIKSAYQVLSELLGYIEKGSASENKIIDATNRYIIIEFLCKISHRQQYAMPNQLFVLTTKEII